MIVLQVSYDDQRRSSCLDTTMSSSPVEDRSFGYLCGVRPIVTLFERAGFARQVGPLYNLWPCPSSSLGENRR